MPHLTRRHEALLFNIPTTSLDAFRAYKLRPQGKTTYQAKKRRPRPPFVPLPDVHAMTPWGDPNVPFDLFHRPTPIIRTDPRKVQERYERPSDEKREEVQRTRPKVIMTPAVDLDAVTDPERQVFVKNIYISTKEKALQDALARAQWNNVKAPLSEVYAPCNPISLPSLEPPYVSPEWRMDSVKWDTRQVRTYADATKSFWLGRDPPKCSVCESSALRDAMKKTKYF